MERLVFNGRTGERVASYTRRIVAVAILAVSFAAARSTFAQDATNVADQVTIFPLPAGLHFQQTMVDADGGVAAGPAEKLIYSNTQGTFAGAVGAGNLDLPPIHVPAAMRKSG